MWQDVDPDNMSYEVSVAIHSHVFWLNSIGKYCMASLVHILS